MGRFRGPNKTVPKERVKGYNAIMRELQGRINYLEKENDFLKRELSNLTKPIRTRKPTLSEQDQLAEWRKGFLERYKQEVRNKRIK